MSATGRHNNSSSRILEYLGKHANVEIVYDQIQKDLELPAYTVSNSIGHLAEKGFDIRRPMRGVVIFHPGNVRKEGKPEKEKQLSLIYEFIGKSGDKVIVRGEDSELYIIRPLFEGQ